jgi:hypothetical protein
MNKIRYYTGVGSRQTPLPVLEKMKEIAKFLAKKGWTLRSGGASGADYDGFEVGCDEAGGKKEIYLPWKGFNNNPSQLLWPQAAWKIAEEIHPAWDRCSVNAKCMHSRNVCQCLGYVLNTPSDFLICWTENGEEKGGTATAIRLARKYKIKIFNLGEEKALDRFRKFCKKNA